MKLPIATKLLILTVLLGACAKEPPPRSVAEFVDKPILLEAAMVRCSRDRIGTRYEAECVNAREAVARIEAKEEAARKAELDAQSEAKRRALRRTQAAAAAARERRKEAERQRREAEYLAQFGVAPPADEYPTAMPSGSVDADAEDVGGAAGNASNIQPSVAVETQQPEASPVDASEEEADPNATDLDAIREEIRRRNSDGND